MVARLEARGVVCIWTIEGRAGSESVALWPVTAEESVDGLSKRHCRLCSWGKALLIFISIAG